MVPPATTDSGPDFLHIDDIAVAYGDQVVLDGLSVDVAAGETLAVVGPSGSGKSTLLRAIAGLETLRRGRIELDGVDLVSIAPHERGIGYMFQEHALFTHLNVADNIAYGPTMAGWSKPRRRSRVGELLELVGLAGYEGRAVDELSGGEAQRVALARSLAPEPRVLLLDEPLGSLDRVLREQLVTDLDRLLSELGQTALHVTHDQAEAFALADRVAVLIDGRLDRVGTPAELWHDPGSRFVAEFLGRANIWPAGEALDRNWVLVPVEAIRVVDPTTTEPASVPVIVRSCRFNQGRYTVVTEVEAPLSCRNWSLPAGLAVTLRSSTPYEVGRRLSVVVDPDAAVGLES